MSLNSTTAYYANLLSLQYIGKRKAYATIQASVDPIVMDNLPSQVQAAYNLSTAVGPQLVVLGKYAGVTKNGFNFSGPVTLSDTDFRSLIQIMVGGNNLPGRNALGSDLASIQTFIHTYFNGVFQIFDHTTMRISYLYDASIGANGVAEFFIKLGLLPRPMSVAMTVVAKPTGNYFAFTSASGAVQPGVSGYNSVASYSTTSPWISVADQIFI